MPIKKAIQELEAWCERNLWFQFATISYAIVLVTAYVVTQVLYYLFGVEHRMVVFILLHSAGLWIAALNLKRLHRWYLTKVRK